MEKESLVLSLGGSIVVPTTDAVNVEFLKRVSWIH